MDLSLGSKPTHSAGSVFMKNCHCQLTWGGLGGSPAQARGGRGITPLGRPEASWALRVHLVLQNGISLCRLNHSNKIEEISL